MKFASSLIQWYHVNKRDLPWRKTKDPYLIWLSEVILQQTRVSQGLPYYLKFAEKFPSVHKLALAKEEDVLKIWQGLGYYTRARNLHKTAKAICLDSNGQFPSDYNTILRLKGIGKYTAAAISSFAYNQCYPVVDGNVKRVLSRIFGISEPLSSSGAEKVFYELAGKLIDRKNPGIFNQAIMEFGALCCTPANPACNSCIFNKNCHALINNRIEEFPLKSPKARVRKRFFNYLVIHGGEHFYLTKRIKSDIWKNLYEFPLIETGMAMPVKKICGLKEWGSFLNDIAYEIKSTSDTVHKLSHQEIHARFIEIRILGKEINAGKKLHKVNYAELARFPLPRIIEKYLAEHTSFLKYQKKYLC